jgi:hypothetical protein
MVMVCHGVDDQSMVLSPGLPRHGGESGHDVAKVAAGVGTWDSLLGSRVVDGPDPSRVTCPPLTGGKVPLGGRPAAMSRPVPSVRSLRHTLQQEEPS